MSKLLADQIEHLGLCPGDLVMVHSSFRSLGIVDPEEIVGALLKVLGPKGNLMMPALSYCQQPPEVFDVRCTPGCVGYLSEYFRVREGTRRSLHPTHSVCAVGREVPEVLEGHIDDSTPCGKNSPFRQLIERHGKVLMLGCGLRPNTTMHAIEEFVEPPYLFAPEREYTMTDESGKVFRKTYITHEFTGFVQRYDRVEGILDTEFLRKGWVGNAECHLIDANALCRFSLEKLRANPYYFVDREAS